MSSQIFPRLEHGHDELLALIELVLDLWGETRGVRSCSMRSRVGFSGDPAASTRHLGELIIVGQAEIVLGVAALVHEGDLRGR